MIVEASKGYGSVLPATVVEALSGAWAPDGLTLSERTTKGHHGVLDMVKAVLRDSRRRGESYKKTALNLFDGYKKGGIIPQQDITKFMSELFQLSAKAGYKELAYRAQLRRVQYALQRLKTPALRSAYSLLVKAIDARNDQAFSKAVYSATQERTRYFAERIARTELRRAYIDGFLAKYQDDPTVLAYRWRMSSAHPVFDICDLYANADLYGLGKGIYPKDKVPLLPAHPHCLCYLMPVRDLNGKVETERIEAGGREYLDTLSTRERQRLLGIYGEKDVRSGVSWTARLRGYSGDILEGQLHNYRVDDILKTEGIILDGLQIEGEKFIPRNTVVMPKRVIAGFGSDKELRIAKRLSEQYGGNPDEWSKLVGIIESSQYLFDVHWYRHKDKGDFGFKIKNKKEKGGSI